MAGETQDELSTARSTTDCDDDRTVLPNGLIVTRIVQIWPTRLRDDAITVATGAPCAATAPADGAIAAPSKPADVRMWMGEVRVDGAKLEEPCYVKLRVLCKARWRSFWTCRNSHSTIEPKSSRYIQFEFPEPALDHLQLNLIAGEHEVKIVLERMPGTETFLWKDTADLRRILLARAAILKEEQKDESSSDISSTSTCFETTLETAYSPTPLSYSDEEDHISHADNPRRSLDPLHSEKNTHQSKKRRSNWSHCSSPIEFVDDLPSLVLSQELQDSLRSILHQHKSSDRRGALFAMVHAIVVDSLRQEGAERAPEVWKEIQRSIGITPFVERVLTQLGKSQDDFKIGSIGQPEILVRTESTISSAEPTG